MSLHRRDIVREELIRSIAWLALGLVGWAILVEELAALDASLLTVGVLPVLTWAALTLGMIKLRLLTSSEAQVETPTGLSTSLVLGIMLGGVGAVYLVAVENHAALWVTAAYVGVTIAAVVWHWYARVPNSPSDPLA